jgi:hypothetical protein
VQGYLQPHCGKQALKLAKGASLVQSPSPWASRPLLLVFKNSDPEKIGTYGIRYFVPIFGDFSTNYSANQPIFKNPSNF